VFFQKISHCHFFFLFLPDNFNAVNSGFFRENLQNMFSNLIKIKKI